MLTVIGQKGDDISLATVSRELNIVPSTVNYWYTRFGFREFKEFKEKKEYNERNGLHRSRKKSAQFNTYFGILTAWEIVAVVKELYPEKKKQISIESVYSRRCKWGEDSPALFFPRTYSAQFIIWAIEIGLTDNKEAFKYRLIKKNKLAKFKVKDFCYRDDFLEKCIHYRSCEDSRCFSNKHHDRFRKDGSCYEYI